MIVASDTPSPVASLSATAGDSRRWIRSSYELLASRIEQARVPILTDDYAPVDRLLSHVLLDRELSER